MLVYRVQHKEDGYGPYSWQQRVEGMGQAHSDDSHPAPYEDTPAVRNFINRHGGHDDAVHGFDSLEALHSWFDGWQKKIDKAGHEVVVFEVPKGYYRRGKQIVFWRNKSKIVDRFPITKTV